VALEVLLEVLVEVLLEGKVDVRGGALEVMGTAEGVGLEGAVETRRAAVSF
jgi:hypothetical protein